MASVVVPASAIGLPSRGARVSTATLNAADAAAGQPQYCKVLGSVDAAEVADPPIQFQMNLPTTWNRKAVQYGGGGFNGVVINAVEPYKHAPMGSATPLAQGYVTFGGDAGHSTGGGEFGTNATAFANYTGESVKRTHDAAAFVSHAYYGSTLGKTYYICGSKGGHEGLVAAKRYPADYDGVAAYCPAAQNLALVYPWYRRLL
ncbi:MAG: hypothetical protein RLZZ200_2505 [Pseudomonadota bacterium]